MSRSAGGSGSSSRAVRATGYGFGPSTGSRRTCWHDSERTRTRSWPYSDIRVPPAQPHFPTWSAWIPNLRRLAQRCEHVRPDRAAELRAEADALERDRRLGGPWPLEYEAAEHSATERERLL